MHRLKKLGLGIFAGAIIIQIALFFMPAKIFAAPTEADIKGAEMKFVSSAHIEAVIGDTTYTFYDKDPFDSTHNYKIVDYPYFGEIDLTEGFTISGAQGGSWITATLDMDYVPEGQLGKVDTQPNKLSKNIQNPQGSKIIVAYSPTNTNELRRVYDVGSFVYTKSEALGSVFIRNGQANATCPDVTVISNAFATVYDLTEDTGGGIKAPAETGYPNCYVGDVNYGVTLGTNELTDNRDGNGVLIPNKFRTPIAPADSRASELAGGAGGETSQASLNSDSCESNSGALGWILCPIAGMLDSITGRLDDEVQSLLIIKDSFFDGYSGDQLKSVWVQLRNISYIVLVPIMLVMVIGTALGFDIFSAYTIKKALPRMAIAIIFITFSWYICTFLIDFFNVLGTGIRGLVTFPFREEIRPGIKGALDMAGITTAETTAGVANNALNNATVAGLGLLGVVGLFATGVVSVGIIGSMLLSAALVIGLAFLILIARQMFIIAALLMAPVAIIAWIFPGNDKLWKFWWGTFSKLLMMFPLIMLIIGVGEVFAYVTGIARRGDNILITSVIVIAATIIPYLLIPFTFKFAGGVFATLSGMVNDREKGLLDRSKKYRAQKRQEGITNFKAGMGQGFAQKNRFTRNVGTRIGAGVGGGKGVFGFGENGRQRLDQLNRQNAVDQVMKSPNWNAINQNDDALMAATYKNENEAVSMLTSRFQREADRKYQSGDITLAQREAAYAQAAGRAQRAAAAVNASVGYGRPQAIAAAQQLVSTGTGYSDLNDMVSTLSRASGNNRSTASSLAGFANFEAKKAGRFDLAPGFGDLDRAVRGAGQNMLDATEPNGKTPEQLQELAWNSGSLYSIANSKAGGMKNHADHWIAERKKAVESGDQQALLKTEIARQEFKAMLPNATGSNAKEINRLIKEMESIDTGSLGPRDMPGWTAGMKAMEQDAQKLARVYDPQDRFRADRDG